MSAPKSRTITTPGAIATGRPLLSIISPRVTATLSRVQFERLTGIETGRMLIVILIAVVILAIVGWAVLGVALKLLWWALLGLVIGALARLVLPGRQAIGWLATAAAGIAGALAGGIIANALDVGNVIQFVLAVIVAAVLVAVLGRTRTATA